MKLLFNIILIYISISSTPENNEINDPLKTPYDKFPNGLIRFPELKLIFEDKSLSKYELREVFNILDISLDNVVDKDEWDKFYSLFIKKYNKCKPTPDYMIPIKDAMKCFKKERFIEYIKKGAKDKKDKKKKLSKFKKMLDINSDGRLNLAEYVFARRTIFIFRKCTFGYTMNYTALQCGLNLMADGSYITSDEARKIMRHSSQLLASEAVSLSYLDFYVIAKYFRTFVALCRPVTYCNLDFEQILNALENQSIHINIGTDAIITFMNASEKKNINFINFFKMSWYYDMYYRFTDEQGRLTKDKFGKLVKDTLTPRNFRKTILNFNVNIEKKYYKKNILVVFEKLKKKNGADIMRFKQRDSAQKPLMSKSTNNVVVSKKSFIQQSMDSLNDNNVDNSLTQQPIQMSNDSSEPSAIQSDSISPSTSSSQENINNSVEISGSSSYDSLEDDPFNVRMKQQEVKKAQEAKDKKKKKSPQEMELDNQLKQLEKPTKHKQVNIVFKISDTDNNKSLSFKEFYRLVRVYDLFSFLVNPVSLSGSMLLYKDKYFERYPLLEQYEYMNQYEKGNIPVILGMLQNAPMNFKQFYALLTLRLAIEKLKTNSLSENHITLIGVVMSLKKYDLKMPLAKRLLNLYKTSEGYLNVNTYRGFDLISNLIQLDQVANYYYQMDSMKNELMNEGGLKKKGKKKKKKGKKKKKKGKKKKFYY